MHFCEIINNIGQNASGTLACQEFGGLYTRGVFSEPNGVKGSMRTPEGLQVYEQSKVALYLFIWGIPATDLASSVAGRHFKYVPSTKTCENVAGNRWLSPFHPEQPLFAVEAGGVAGEGAAAADYTVAGDDEGDGVVAHGAADGTGGHRHRTLTLADGTGRRPP